MKMRYNYRILEPDGHLNIHFKNIPNKHRRLVADLGNTLITIRWRWILLTLTIANCLAWIVFAFVWMALAMYHDDFGKPDSAPDVCIVATRHFTGYLLLSIETLTTIGSGEIYPANCPHSWIVLILQALTGVAIEGALVTAVYAKMSRPTKNVNGLFSHRAIVSLRDGKVCLVFRLFDPIGRYWAKCKIKAFVVQSRGDFYMRKLQLEPCELLTGPVDVVHVITRTSPFWMYTASDFLTQRLEIVLTVNGDSATTGQPSQAKKSYTNREIQWGCRFVNCVDYDENAESYVVDLNRFNSTLMCEIPLCSAFQLDILMKQIHQDSEKSTSTEQSNKN